VSSINGIDPIVVNNIKVQAQKSIVLETQRTKVSDEKKDKNRKNNSEHPPEKSSQKLSLAVNKLNHLLEQNKIPLYFQIINENQGVRIQLINANNQDIIAEMSPEKVFKLVIEFNTKGFTIDELI